MKQHIHIALELKTLNALNTIFFLLYFIWLQYVLSMDNVRISKQKRTAVAVLNVKRSLLAGTKHQDNRRTEERTVEKPSRIYEYYQG